MVPGLPLLVALTLQRSAGSFLFHTAGKHVTLPTSSVILLSELVKQAVCIVAVILRKDQGSSQILLPVSSEKAPSRCQCTHSVKRENTAEGAACSRCNNTSSRVAAKVCAFVRATFSRHAWKLLLPAAVFVLQNNLTVATMTRLKPSYYQAAWQARLLPTAIVGQQILGKKFSQVQWLSLVGIIIGVVVLHSAHEEPGAGPGATLDLQSNNFLIGNLCLFLACFSSAFGNTLMERLYRQADTDFWLASYQMSLFSTMPAFVLVFQDCLSGPSWSSNFQVFTQSAWPWLAVLIQAMFGVLSPLTTKYAGSVPNNIAGVAAIALLQVVDMLSSPRGNSSVVSHWGLSWLGVGIIMYCTHSYFAPSSAAQASAPMAAAKSEERPMSEKTPSRMSFPGAHLARAVLSQSKDFHRYHAVPREEDEESQSSDSFASHEAPAETRSTSHHY